MDLATLVVRMEDDPADQRADVARGIEPDFRVAACFDEPRDLALVDFGDAGMSIGDVGRRLGKGQSLRREILEDGPM